MEGTSFARLKLRPKLGYFNMLPCPSSLVSRVIDLRGQKKYLQLCSLCSRVKWGKWRAYDGNGIQVILIHEGISYSSGI